MRGCFNSVIASLILADDNLQEGCHEIPRKFGTGQICVCDSNLCNSATSLRMGSIPSKFSIFGTVKHDIVHIKMYGPNVVSLKGIHHWTFLGYTILF